MFAPLPELNLLDRDAETAPEAGQWNFALLEFLLQFKEFAFQHAAGRNSAGLFLDPGANLAVTLAAV